MSLAIWRRTDGHGGFQVWGDGRGRLGTGGERPKTPHKALDFALYAEGATKGFSAQGTDGVKIIFWPSSMKL